MREWREAAAIDCAGGGEPKTAQRLPEERLRASDAVVWLGNGAGCPLSGACPLPLYPRAGGHSRPQQRPWKRALPKNSGECARGRTLHLCVRVGFLCRMGGYDAMRVDAEP